MSLIESNTVCPIEFKLYNYFTQLLGLILVEEQSSRNC